MLSTTPTRRPGTRGSRAARDIFQSKSAGGTVRSAQKHAAPLFCAARNLALLQEFCAQQGTSFLFVCAPNKNTVYPEFMPARYVRSTSERNLCWLCTRPPLLPAPVREQTFDGATDFGTLDVTHSSAPWDDLSCYTGTFSTFMPDADAPVHVLADGAC